MIAERVSIILDDILLIKPLSAVVTDHSQPVGAILAEPIAFRLIHIFD